MTMPLFHFIAVGRFGFGRKCPDKILFQFPQYLTLVRPRNSYYFYAYELIYVNLGANVGGGNFCEIFLIVHLMFKSFAEITSFVEKNFTSKYVRPPA